MTTDTNEIQTPDVLTEKVVRDTLHNYRDTDDAELLDALNRVAHELAEGAEHIIDHYEHEDYGRVEKQTETYTLVYSEVDEWSPTFESVGLDDPHLQSFVREVYDTQARYYGADPQALGSLYVVIVPTPSGERDG